MANEVRPPATFASENQGGTPIAWANPSNAASSNDTRAIAASLSSTAPSERLRVTNFGFTVPGDATIVGIKDRIERREQNNAGSGLRDFEVKQIVGGSVTGENKADTVTEWPTSDTSKEYGGETDLWTLTPTVAQVNTSNFGTALIAETAGVGSSGDAEVDYIEKTVYYTEAAPFDPALFPWTSAMMRTQTHRRPARVTAF